MKLLAFWIAFSIFASAPSAGSLQNFSLEAQFISSHSGLPDGASAFYVTPSSSEETEGESDEESKSSKQTIEDDDKLFYFSAFAEPAPCKIFFPRQSLSQEDDIAKRLFKPPKV